MSQRPPGGQIAEPVQATCWGCVHIGHRRAAIGISEAHSGHVLVVGVSSAPAWRRASRALIGLTTKK